MPDSFDDRLRQARQEGAFRARLDNYDEGLKQLRDGHLEMSKAVRDLTAQVSELTRVFGAQTTAARDRAVGRRVIAVGLSSALITSIVSLIVGLAGGHL